MNNEIDTMNISENEKIETFNLNTDLRAFEWFVNKHRPCTIKYVGPRAIVLYKDEADETKLA